MMKIRITTFLLICFSAANAQDIHFSQYYHSPLTLNPAMTGIIDGDYRFVLNYRNQWRSVMNYTLPDNRTSYVPFKTISLSYDMHLAPRQIPDGTLGAGIVIFSDKAGHGDLSNQTVMLSGSYLTSIGPIRNHHLSFGLQTGFVSKSIDYSKLYFHNQFNGVDGFDMDIKKSKENILGENFNYMDIGIGAAWSHPFTDRITASAGMAMFHINKPSETFINSQTNKLDSRFVFHGGAEYVLNKKMKILPGIRYVSQAKDQELNLGGFATYHLGEATENDIMLFGGLWSRMSFRNKNSDALFPAFGAKYQNWTAGLSYDINVSSLKGIKGGPEIAIIYVGNIFRPMPVKPILPCTRF